MSDPVVDGMYVLIVVIAFLALLVLLAAPMEYAEKRSPRFSRWLDRVIERVFP